MESMSCEVKNPMFKKSPKSSETIKRFEGTIKDLSKYIDDKDQDNPSFFNVPSHTNMRYEAWRMDLRLEMSFKSSLRVGEAPKLHQMSLPRVALQTTAVAEPRPRQRPKEDQRRSAVGPLPSAGAARLPASSSCSSAVRARSARRPREDRELVQRRNSEF